MRSANKNKNDLIKELGFNANLFIDSEVREKIKILMEEQWKKGNYFYTSFSDFFRKSLINYEKGKISIDSCYELEKKKMVTFNLKEKKIIELYNLIPKRIKSRVINSILKAQLDKELKNQVEE